MARRVDPDRLRALGQRLRRVADGARSRVTRQGERPAGNGVVLAGAVWLGAAGESVDGTVVLDGAGTIVHIGAPRPQDDGFPVMGGPGHWIGPGLIDRHVRSSTPARPGGALLAVRELSGPHVPATVADPAAARVAVHRIAVRGGDVVTMDLDESLDPRIVRAVVDTAHAAGLRAVAVARSVRAVARALDAGVDELARTPVERLPETLVARLLASEVSVVSCLQANFRDGGGPDAARNAAALVEAGVPLTYGTAGDGRQVDPRELDRMAAAGLGRAGAVQAAGGAGGIRLGSPAGLVLLPFDPLLEPGAWRIPVATFVRGRRVSEPSAAARPAPGRSARLGR